MKLKRGGVGVPIFSNGYMLECILSLLLGVHLTTLVF